MHDQYLAERIEAAEARRRAEALTASGGTLPAGDPELLEELGGSLKAMGKLPEAFTAYAAYADTVPDPGQVPLMLADVACKMGSLDAAESHARRFLDVHPEDPSGLEMAARIEFQRAAEAGGWGEARGHLQKAEVLLEKALAVEPEMPAALTSLARVTYLLGDPAAAARLATRALGLDPANRRARGLLRVLGQRARPGGW
jgi:tetratricopeptide (TPR) repeat protein